jgi:hypothetical protein
MSGEGVPVALNSEHADVVHSVCTAYPRSFRFKDLHLGVRDPSIHALMCMIMCLQVLRTDMQWMTCHESMSPSPSFSNPHPDPHPLLHHSPPVPSSSLSISVHHCPSLSISILIPSLISIPHPRHDLFNGCAWQVVCWVSES